MCAGTNGTPSSPTIGRTSNDEARSQLSLCPLCERSSPGSHLAGSRVLSSPGSPRQFSSSFRRFPCSVLLLQSWLLASGGLDPERESEHWAECYLSRRGAGREDHPHTNNRALESSSHHAHLTGVFAFTSALATRCALRVLDRHRNNGRANQGDAKNQHGKCQNQSTQVDQPDRTIRVLGAR